MPGSLSYRVQIDRQSSIYDLNVDYYIDPYSDPETGEYFPDTSWSLAYYRLPSGPGGASSGFVSSESNTVSGGLLFDSAPGLFHYQIEFRAWNTFSGDLDPLVAKWDLFSAALATAPQAIAGTDTTDIVLGGSGADVISSFGGNDIVDAGEGDDTVNGGDGSDTLDGSVGNDTLLGGTGDDFFTVDSSEDHVVEFANEGYDTVFASLSYTLPAEVEQLSLLEGGGFAATGNTVNNQLNGNNVDNALYGLDGDDTLRGGAGNDKLYGGSGDDTLQGDSGDDIMEGGAGNDTYYVDSVKDRIIETAGGGDRDKVITFFLPVYKLSGQIEDLQATVFGNFHGIGNDVGNGIDGGDYNDVLEGAGGGDTLRGNGGNDLLSGGAAADGLYGGAGVDTVIYDTSPSGVTVDLGKGTGKGGDAEGDQIFNVENVIGSKWDDKLRGSEIANVLTGGSGLDSLSGAGGNDLLKGGAGADIIDGGNGTDTAIYADSAAPVTVDLEQMLQLGKGIGGDAEGDILSNVENVIGSNGNDKLTGDAGNNVLSGGLGADTIKGGKGNDTIIGGAGADKLDGGEGRDTLSYAGSVGAVTVNLTTRLARGGDAQGNLFGDGIHRYARVDQAGAGLYSPARPTFDTFDTFANFEDVRGGNGADDLTGNSEANALFGGAGADTIRGEGGNDTISGGADADTLDGGDGLDTLSYSDSSGGVSVDMINQSVSGSDATGDTIVNFENVEGSNYSDWILGNGGNNRIIGGGGVDFLDGYSGDDTLTGGDGTDVFAFSGAFGRDIITDFAAIGSSVETITLNLGPKFDTFAEVMAVAVPAGTSQQHTVLKFGADTSLTLLNVKSFHLTADNFAFV